MKKLLILAIVLVIVSSSSVFASTIGVDVTPGFYVDLSKQIDPSEDPFTLIGGYGLNEQL